MNKITRKPYNYNSINYLVDNVTLRRVDRCHFNAFRAYRKGYIDFIKFRRRMKWRNIKCQRR